MTLSKIQKKFVNYLIINKSKLLNEYPVHAFINDLLIKNELRIEVDKSKNTLTLFKAMNGMLTSELVINTFAAIDGLYLLIIETVDIIKYLESQKLIRTYSKKPFNEAIIELGISKTISGQDSGTDEPINRLFIEYLEKGIIVKKELLIYRNKRYQTAQLRKEKFIKWSTWIAISISFLMGLGSILTNIFIQCY